MEFINQNNANFNNFINVFKNKTNVDRVMRLNVYVEGIDSLRDKYLEVAKKHNEKIMREPFFFDVTEKGIIPQIRLHVKLQLFIRIHNGRHVQGFR